MLFRSYAYALKGILDRANIKDAKKSKITGSVLYFPIEYDIKGNISHVGEFKEKKFRLNFDAFKVIKEKPSFLYKEEKNTDPSIANAGKKKGGNTAKVKKGEVKSGEKDTKSKKGDGKLELRAETFTGKKYRISFEDIQTMFDYFEDKNDIDSADKKEFERLKKDIKKTIESGDIKEVPNLDFYLQSILTDSVLEKKIYNFSEELTNNIYDSIQSYYENEEYKEFCKS